MSIQQGKSAFLLCRRTAAGRFFDELYIINEVV